MRKTILLSLAVFFVVTVGGAFAVPTDYLLPESSYAMAMGDWQGSTFYDRLWNDGWLRGRIDFAVYDSTSLQGGSEEEALVTALGLPGRFVYAYQVINDFDASDEAVTSFTLFGDELLGLDLYEDSIGKYDDGSGGRASTSEYLTGDKLRVVWEFTGGLIYKGEHSWFLVFGSDYAPVVGDYEIQGTESEPPPIPGEIPEPVTVALLGFGAAFAASVRRVRRKPLRL